MRKEMQSTPDLRATVEYEEAVFLLALKKIVQLELQAVKADLKGVERISRKAMSLAREDLKHYANGDRCARIDSADQDRALRK